MLADLYRDMMTYYSNLRRIDDIPDKEDTIDRAPQYFYDQHPNLNHFMSNFSSTSIVMSNV